MKLLIILNDAPGVRMTHSEFGTIRQLRKRAVEIELTPEQNALIDLSQIKADNGRLVYEEIESVSIISRESARTKIQTSEPVRTKVNDDDMPF
jgi:hypothetical protein